MHHIYICMYVCMYLCIYVSMYLCIYVCIYVSMYVCISMYVCMYVSICINMYVCTRSGPLLRCCTILSFFSFSWWTRAIGGVIWWYVFYQLPNLTQNLFANIVIMLAQECVRGRKLYTSQCLLCDVFLCFCVFVFIYNTSLSLMCHIL